MPSLKSSSPAPSSYEVRLRRLGLKATRVRLELLKVFASRHVLLTIEEAAKKVSRTKADLSTVYRSIRTFEEAGLLVPIELGDGLLRYELRDESLTVVGSHSHHHHHLVCRDCRKVEPLEDCEIHDLPLSVVDSGYTSIEHRLNFFGVCPKCQVTRKTRRLS